MIHTIKSSIVILLGCLGAGCLSSCSKSFLDKKPIGVLNTSVLNNENGVNSLLIGAYSLLDGTGSGIESYSASPRNWVWDCASDDAYKGSTLADYSFIGELERYEAQPTNVEFVDSWLINYDGIARANDVLRTLKTSTGITQAESTVIEGQARFLRAWFHLALQKEFYQVPYITEDDQPEKVKNDHPIWDEIGTDLQFAIDNLPASFPGEPGRATKWAATAVKAYTLLFQQKYSDAKPLLDNIINSNQFGLVDKFFDNYRVNTENNKESIFEIQSAVNDGSPQGKNGNGDSWTTNPNNRFVPTCCGQYQPSQDVVNAFKVDSNGLPLLGINGPKYNDVNLKNDMGITSATEFHPADDLLDPRLDWSVGRRGIPYLDWGVHTGFDWIRAQANGGPYNTKKEMFYKADQAIASNSTFARATAINFRAIRYAHVLLWRAECAVNEGDLETARQLVNQVRVRAGNELVMGRVLTYQLGAGVTPVVDYTQPAANYKIGTYPAFTGTDQAWAAVQMEERLEFTLEGFRFFDLVRWGIDDQVLSEYIIKDAAFRTFMMGAHYTKGKNDNWPLPQTQLDLEPGVLDQDPAYK
jgi:hypothetical protein